MIRHQILMIYRSFLRFRSTFLINWFGLSTGMACTILIYLWVMDERSVDKFNKKDDRLYIVMENRIRNGGIWTSRTTPGPMAEALANDMPEVEYAISCAWEDHLTITVGDKDRQSFGVWAGPQFFQMFTHELLEGDPAQVLKDKHSVVLTKNLALQLFGTTEGLLGKSITLNHKGQYQITGICEAAPENSTEQFEFVIPFEAFREANDWLQGWGNTGLQTYVLLRPEANVVAFNKKIRNLVKEKTQFDIVYRTPFLKKYSDGYLYDHYDNGEVSGGKITYVKMFSIIAVVILLIACINFMNLSTAKAARRIKEVGIKKAIGARREVLMLQYLGESMFMSFFSLLLAILMVDLFLPYFNAITAKKLALSATPSLLITALVVTAVTGLIAGSYPAFYLSGFNPSRVLKGKLTTSFGEVWARKGLVVFQFSLSIIFIVSVIVIYSQLKFVQSANLGYSNDHIMYIPSQGNATDKNKETFIMEAKRIPGITAAAAAGHSLRGHNGGTWGVEWEGKNPNDRTEFERMPVSYGLTELLDIKILEGRTFSRDFISDTSAIIFNEAGIKFMGLKDPIGKTVKLWGTTVKIIGVAKDFNFESLHTAIKPLFIFLNPSDTWMLMVKIEPGKEQQVIPALEKFYAAYNPGFPFEYRFLDVQYQTQYAAEQRVSLLSRYFAGLAILISCLGLFGLAAFTAERRLKEIGIRKVLGSSVLRIVSLLSFEFTKLVLVAAVIGLPVSYFLLRTWLSQFAYRTPLSWIYFVSAGFAALVIAWITVGVQAYKAANVEPAKCLKDE